MFIKLYDWMLQHWDNKDEAVIFALINQMSENGAGWFAGLPTLANITNIRTKDCNKIIKSLKNQNAIYETRIQINNRTHKTYLINPDFYNIITTA